MSLNTSHIGSTEISSGGISYSGNNGRIGGGGISGKTPAPLPSHILTEGGDILTTESGDRLVTES